MTDRIVVPGTNKTLTEPTLASMSDSELASVMELSTNPFMHHLVSRLRGTFYTSQQQCYGEHYVRQ